MKKPTVLVSYEWIFVAWSNISSDSVLKDFRKYCFSNSLNRPEDYSCFDTFR